MAVQVHPPLEEEETNMFFVNTLRAPFFGHRIGNSSKTFADIVNAGEMIEMAIKSGKLDGGESSRKPPARRKDNEVSNVKKYDSNNITVSQPQATVSSTLNPVQQRAKEPRQERERPPYPKWFDINAQCEYYAGASGHSIENCPAFKKLVHRLRQRNVINFGDSEQPNVAQNPLPNHTGTGVNAVIEEKGNGVITKVKEVKSSMHWVWGKMVKIGWLTFNANENKHACPYHCCEDHVIQNSDEFKALVQRLIDSKDMEFYHEATKEKEIEICASEGTSKGVYNTNCPLVITPKAQTMERLIPKIVITPPSSFPYKDNKQVPWRYGCQLKNVESSEVAKEEVDEVGHFTRSGRCYSPNQTSEPEKMTTVDKGKRVEILLKNDEPTINEPVTENDATFVPKDVPVEKIDRLVANIQADNFISFSDDEILSGMMGNPKALNALDPPGRSRSIYSASKLKFVIEGRLVCINAEEDIIASISTTAQYVEVDEDAVECTFRVLEFINATFVAERKKIPKPRLSNYTKMGLKMTLGRGAKVGRGLGSRLQGNISPAFPGFKLDRFGLGYRPTLKEKLKNVQKCQEKRRARLAREDIKWEPMIFPSLRDTFI
ncbi:uncharacterized protein LOC120207558 [Hibiscus syriacus]|uniref:uncharacterized protein LOC120207558 n=1 Tax=Hibiscus syriacus TaxID=106335 RepID=UPI0019236212|nr:uncharacterized protein LOC120207558 [Hibiscus syriacus]